MDCTEFLHRYSEYDDSLIAPPEVDRFRSHMEACGSCTRYDRVLRKGRMLARQLPPVEPSDDFVLRLRTRLWRQSRGGERLLERPARSAGALTAVTLVLALTVLLGLLGGGGPPVVDILLAEGTSAPHGLPSRASPALPAIPPPALRAWTAVRVDRPVRSSYSPLIIGPPAYRGARAHSAISIPTHRTLD